MRETNSSSSLFFLLRHTLMSIYRHTPLLASRSPPLHVQHTCLCSLFCRSLCCRCLHQPHDYIIHSSICFWFFFSNHFVSSSLDSTHVYNHLHRAHSIQAPCLLLCTLFAQQLSMTVTISTDGLVLLLELSMHLCHRRCAFVLLVCVTSSFVYCRRQLCCILSPQSRCSTGYKVSLRYTFFD